jgi:hypothetical protein
MGYSISSLLILLDITSQEPLEGALDMYGIPLIMRYITQIFMIFHIGNRELLASFSKVILKLMVTRVIHIGVADTHSFIRMEEY